jgi:hypothetical protein
MAHVIERSKLYVDFTANGSQKKLIKYLKSCEQVEGIIQIEESNTLVIYVWEGWTEAIVYDIPDYSRADAFGFSGNISNEIIASIWARKQDGEWEKY